MIQQTLDPCQVDLFATRINHQLQKYIEWKPDPFAQGTDAFKLDWKEMEGYAFPPFCLTGKCIQKILKEQSTITMVVPWWHSQACFPVLLEIVADFPLFLPNHRDLLKDPGASTNVSRKPETSHLQSIRRQHTAKGVSEKATELLLARWGKGTNAAYQSRWARRSHWCSEREVDPFSFGNQPFLDFLADLYGEGLQYRCMNSVRSAVFMTHNTIEGAPIGQHALVSRMMRSIYV